MVVSSWGGLFNYAVRVGTKHVPTPLLLEDHGFLVFKIITNSPRILRGESLCNIYVKIKINLSL